MGRLQGGVCVQGALLQCTACLPCVSSSNNNAAARMPAGGERVTIYRLPGWLLWWPQINCSDPAEPPPDSVLGCIGQAQLLSVQLPARSHRRRSLVICQQSKSTQ